jgi:hypothetical protein
MITNLLLNFVVLILGAVFSFLPVVTSLPSVGSFDLDSALVSGVAQLHTVFLTFWPLKYLVEGFLILMGYYVVKMIITFFLGHRAPGK